MRQKTKDRINTGDLDDLVWAAAFVASMREPRADIDEAMGDADRMVEQLRSKARELSNEEFAETYLKK